MLSTALYVTTLAYLVLVILDLSRAYQNRRIREGVFILVLVFAIIHIFTR